MLSPWPRVFDLFFLSTIPNFGDKVEREVRDLSIDDSLRYREIALTICQTVANISRENIFYGLHNCFTFIAW